MENTLEVRLLHAIKTEAEWTSTNPILLEGEVGYTSDKIGLFKIGDGVSDWNSLSYGRSNGIEGMTATVAELNYSSGLKGNIQKQLDALDKFDNYLPLSGGTLTGSISLTVTKNIFLRPGSSNYTAGIGYDTRGNECIALWAKNTVTRLRWYAGKDMSTMTAGTMMDITPDFEVDKSSGSAVGYIAGNTILHSGNYTNYTVTKTGSGASGTWGISISGHSATATKLVTARTINGTSFDGSANITTANWGTARIITIGNTGKSVNGSANVSWSANEIGYKYTWTATIYGQTWSRLCYVPITVSTVGCSYILNICATRNMVVYNDTFIIKTHHSSNGKIIKISGNNYSSGHKIRLLADSTGNSYIELYDDLNSIATSTIQDVHCTLVPIYCGVPTTYTAFTSGASLPTNFSVRQTMTISTTDMQGNLDGNATGLIDQYNGKTITATYGKTGQSSTQWLASWNGYELGSISPSKVSVGSANKLTTARTFTIGATSKTFDGSGNISWNLSEIGAAASSHTHTLEQCGSVGYYGSDIADTAGWYKVYSTTITGYADQVARLSLIYGYNTQNYGVINLHIRCDNASTVHVKTLKWETRTGFAVGDVIIVTSGNTWTLYVKNNNARYGRIKVRVLESMGTSLNWVMTLSSNYTVETTAPTATATATDGATVNYANSAGSASTLSGYSASSSATANTIALRTSNGFINATYFNQSSGAETPTTSSYIMYANSDGYLRKSSLANVKTILGLGSAAYTASTAYAAASHKQAYTSEECDSYTSDTNTMGVTPAAVKKAITQVFEPKAHTHGLLHSDFTTVISNTTTDSGWSMINSTYKGFLLKSLRTQANAPGWAIGNYSAGIAFGGEDTKGVITCAYNSPNIKFAGGNSTKPVWNMSIYGTSGKSYNLDGFSTTSHTHSYLPLSGGTMTGSITMKGGNYTDASNTGELNMNNSDIYGINSLKFADACENAAEGLQFYRSSTAVDSLWANSGVLYFTPNRTWGNTSATNYTLLHSGNYSSYVTKVGTSTIGGSTTPIYLNNGIPTACSYTLGKSVPSNAVFTDTNTHYTSRIYAGASGTASNAATSNPYIKITDDNTYRNQIQIKGGGATSVSSDANGVITITSTDTNTNTNTTYKLTKSGSTITLTGSDGSTTSVTDADTNTTYSAATTSAAGLMSASDKSKLDGITGENMSKTLTVTGWNRIATSPSYIGNCSGIFSIIASMNGYHTTVVFEAHTSYGNADGTYINILGVSNYSNPALAGIRIVYNTNYSGKYAYIDVTTVSGVSIKVQSLLVNGWSLVSSNTATVPSGYSQQVYGLGLNYYKSVYQYNLGIVAPYNTMLCSDIVEDIDFDDFYAPINRPMLINNDTSEMDNTTVFETGIRTIEFLSHEQAIITITGFYKGDVNLTQPMVHKHLVKSDGSRTFLRQDSV